MERGKIRHSRLKVHQLVKITHLRVGSSLVNLARAFAKLFCILVSAGLTAKLITGSGTNIDDKTKLVFPSEKVSMDRQSIPNIATTSPAPASDISF